MKNWTDEIRNHETEAEGGMDYEPFERPENEPTEGAQDQVHEAPQKMYARSGFYEARLDSPSLRRARRKRRLGALIRKAALFALAAALLALLVCASARLFHDYGLVRYYDEDIAGGAFSYLQESGRQLDRMGEILLDYVEMTSFERVLPDRERTEMIGRISYEYEVAIKACSDAQKIVYYLETTGGMMRDTKRPICVDEMVRMFNGMRRNAALMRDCTQAAADMMTDEALWAQHGRAMLSCLREMAQAVREITRCELNLILRQFMTGEELLEALRSGDMYGMMTDGSDGMLFEKQKKAERALSGAEYAMEAFIGLYRPAPVTAVAAPTATIAPTATPIAPTATPIAPTATPAAPTATPAAAL